MMRRREMKTLIAMTLAAATGAVLFGCDKGDRQEIVPKTTDFGTGLNAVEHTYVKPANELVEVVVASLKSYDLKLESDRHDELGGEMVALRADGHKVTVKITSVDKEHSQVSIRVAPGNKNLAEMIHQRIAEKCSAGGAK
jgi:hypothetical protein